MRIIATRRADFAIVIIGIKAKRERHRREIREHFAIVIIGIKAKSGKPASVLHPLLHSHTGGMPASLPPFNVCEAVFMVFNAPSLPRSSHIPPVPLADFADFA